MKMSLRRAIVLALSLGAGVTPTLAADGTLVLVMGGEAYDGPPKFEVGFNGAPLGQGTVAAAIDTSTAGRFADATDKTAYVQTFTFAVPQAAFDATGQVTVKFLNEAYGGDGSNRDRNLYLASVSLNGRAITASGLVSEVKGGTVDNRMLGEFLVLSDGNVTAIAPAPVGGWPAADGAVAGGAVDAVVTGSTSAPAAVEQVSAPEPVIPAPGAPPPAPATPQPEVAVAAVEPVPAAEPVADHAAGDRSARCDLDEIYNVIGFNENSNALTDRLAARLDQIVADIGTRTCNVAITGYSSHDGSIASNALFSLERAQNALRYLEAHGVAFLTASATGAGATEKFGADVADNRRVVITVTP